MAPEADVAINCLATRHWSEPCESGGYMSATEESPTLPLKSLVHPLEVHAHSLSDIASHEVIASPRPETPSGETPSGETPASAHSGTSTGRGYRAFSFSLFGGKGLKFHEKSATEVQSRVVPAHPHRLELVEKSKGHGFSLKSLTKSSTKWKCDGCAMRSPEATYMLRYRCAEGCDFDLCDDCYTVHSSSKDKE
eukprot:TRINITY_DN2947_c0_g1_i1.p1 TRINITY_DN2947_c0_g1~~TRINITY_DN2947_c0_g1_i1.p1  ORF type:complete len:194 (-),score=34.82 TRINITY_DN2947_c0_g1_i1:249-830(-)